MLDRVFAAKIDKAFSGIIHIDASSVADFFWESSQNSFGHEDYINCAPPWPQFALHFPIPKLVRSNNNNETIDTVWWKNLMSHILGMSRSYAFVFAERRGREGSDADGLWGMNFFLFADSLPSPGFDGPMPPPIVVGDLFLNKDGSVRLGRGFDKYSYVQAFLGMAKSLNPNLRILKFGEEDEESIARSMITTHPVVRQRAHTLGLDLSELNVLADLACLAITFLHCKNIGLADVNCPPASPKRGKKYRNRQQDDKVDTYKVLEINPFRQAARAANGGEEPGIKKALHICRGHFKTYTPEKPLLGRHTGTFWFPQHIKGNPDQGTVTKDYVVGPIDCGLSQ